MSHDRYFVERVCDNVWALGSGSGSGGIRHLPGGIDQYLEPAVTAARAPRSSSKAATPGAQLRATRKEVQRLERELERASEREHQLQEQMAASASDHERLSELDAELQAVVAERERLETAWLEVAESLEG